MSGESKRIDEIELQEIRESLLTPVYSFEIDLLNKMRAVWNYHESEKLDESAEFEVTFQETKPYESVQDTHQRRKSDKEFFIRDEIDMIMEAFEMTQEEAAEYLEERKARAGNESRLRGLLRENNLEVEE